MSREVSSPWHEQSVTIPLASQGLVLEGVWQAGEHKGAVIAPPHPEYGGSLDSPVVNEIAYGLHREGYASLRFNWRGVGASQGRLSGDVAAAIEDYEAALAHLERTLPRPIIGAGYSFGAAIALRVATRNPRIRELVLVAPPPAMLRDLALEKLGRPLRVIVGSEDAFAPVGELAELLDPLPGAELRVIPGADHFFATVGLAELSQLVRED
jgi:alpha/beta superfamily hydrolase